MKKRIVLLVLALLLSNLLIHKSESLAKANLPTLSTYKVKIDLNSNNTERFIKVKGLNNVSRITANTGAIGVMSFKVMDGGVYVRGTSVGKCKINVNISLINPVGETEVVHYKVKVRVIDSSK